MKWVTRSHVHVDRIACPWLISKFIDKDAEFIFIPWPGPVPTPEMGTPFDFPIPELELGHHDGKCTFEILLEKYPIKDQWVQEIAKIVHAADIEADRDKKPEARGLEAISAGSMYLVKDDNEALERGFGIYDALYVYVQLEPIRQMNKNILKQLEKTKTFDYLKSQIKMPPIAKVKKIRK